MNSIRVTSILLVIIFFSAACSSTNVETEPSATSSPPETESEAVPPDLSVDATSTPTPTESSSPSPEDEMLTAVAGTAIAFMTETAAASVAPPGPPEEPTRPPPIIDPSAAIPHLAPGEDVIISYIDMQDATNGWAVGGIADPGGHVLRTNDGGTTWQDFTPPEPDSEPGEPRKIAKAFFLDDNTAWVTFSFVDFFTSPSSVIVWSTTNGGSTWTPSAYLDTGGMVETYGPTFLYFVDSTNGWFLVSVGAGMSHDYSLFFRTIDGGATWTKIADPTNSEYLQGCCKTGMAFVDASIGMVTYEQGPYTSVYVEWTYDGGITWEFMPLPSPETDPNLFENAYCESHSTHFTLPSVLIGVSCRTFQDDGTVSEDHYLYSTNDVGQTWYSEPYPGGAIQQIGPDFALLLGRDIYELSTNPYGWVFIKSVIWDGQFSFVRLGDDLWGIRFGWAVARDGDEIALVMTSDGGNTWGLLEPVIGS